MTTPLTANAPIAIAQRFLLWLRAPSLRQSIDEEQFAYDLSLMLRSGLRLLEGLRTMLDREAGPSKQWLLNVLLRLEQGQPLSKALQAAAEFSPSLLACIRASEVTGDLGDSLQRFALNAGRIRVLRTRLISACVYPALLVAVASLVVLFLLMYVVPRFAVVLESSTKDMPFMSRVLVDVGTALAGVQAPLLMLTGLVLTVAAAAAWRGVRTRQLGPWAIDVAAHLPWLREYLRAFGLAQLSRSGAMLVRSGVPVLKALRMCHGLLPGIDRPRLDQALSAATAGAPLARALHDAGLFDTLGFRVLKVAEQTGQLDAALDRVADLYDSLLERALERLGRLVEPVLMLVIGTVVGGIVVMMYLPIFQLAASIR